MTSNPSLASQFEAIKQNESNMQLAKFARAAIHKEHDKRVKSGSEFDVGFACGLSFALGAFSGVCEEKE